MRSTVACSRSTTRCWCAAPTRCSDRSPSVTWTRTPAGRSTLAWPRWSTDPDDRARHLALAAVDRDAARRPSSRRRPNRAGRRGAPRVAAELAAHSLRLTPIDDRPALARRAVAEILHRAAAGETGRAIAMIDAIVAGLPPGPERFAALALRVGIDFGSAEEVLAQAQDEADADELVRGRILDLLAYMTYMYRGHLARARELEAEALTIARRHDDTELEMLASATLATIALLSGDPQPDLFDRALELGRQVQNPRLGRWPDVERARQCVWGGQLAEAREVFTATADDDRQVGHRVPAPVPGHGHGVRRARRRPPDRCGRARRRRVGVGARLRQRIDGRVAPLPRWSRSRPPRLRRRARPPRRRRAAGVGERARRAHADADGAPRRRRARPRPRRRRSRRWPSSWKAWRSDVGWDSPTRA